MSLFRSTQARASTGYFTSPNQFVPTRLPLATAGVPVTPTTAMQKIPLLAATNLVANTADLLPLEVLRGTGSGTQAIAKPRVLSDPEGQDYGFGDFGYKFLTSLILRGNAFIRVDGIDGMGKPSVVTLLPPDEVSVRRDARNGQWTFHHLDSSPMLRFGEQGVGGLIHRRAFAQPGQVLGLSVVANHARTIGLSIASEQFGADFFADGAHPTGILTSDKEVTGEQAITMKARFLANRGSREPTFLGNGMKYQQIQVAPNESQFLEAQRYTSAELCRMVGPGCAEILGYETGGAMTYQNIQMRSLHLLIYAIDPWLVRLERLMSSLFLSQAAYVQFDRDALLRMTAGDRWDVFTKQLKLGARTINEVRDDENEGPVDWGDEPFMPAFGPAAAAAELNNDPALAGKDIGPAPDPVPIPAPAPARSEQPINVTVEAPQITVESAKTATVRRTVERDEHGNITAILEGV